MDADEQEQAFYLVSSSAESWSNLG